ncbi:mannosyl-oligosaccharide alpha-1,2-mannosidase [Friedmanniomyces endolithicus]|nr:mannosyl-oligosaccharide alpha-1,2-mannosidase [Friedmanniomyces endolithicus]KAK0294701.1 mannosyl-oligosaccharide alpha-1,2-mannosidase [Friedmanniomyces endolithicus]KAK1009691.1 mannosyl-oligosaccharide alpha-1,2-mannosidase [Friedmanniomyces endolithicus]
MAYAPPSGPTHRHGDSWQSSGQSRFNANGYAPAGVSEKIGDIFGSDRKGSLPMYKDKPYQYPSGRRKMPWFRRKRVIASILLSVAGLSWWFGILSPLSFLTGGLETTVSKKSKSSWNLFGSGGGPDWDDRPGKVREAFRVSFADYEKHAWGDDEYHPVAKTGKKMVPNGLGWIIVDALDTMMLMNLTTELEHSRQWIHNNLTYDQDHDVSTFETTIRMLGGLLSAHYLSSSFPGVYAPVNDGMSDDMYVEKATDLADRLLGAFETQSGVPLASVNLHTMKGIPSHADAGASSTAEATSVQLEMKYLAKLTGETQYWDRAEHVMKVVDDNDMPDGLLPIFIYADQGAFRGNNIRLGSRGDSYYEYLIKQYLQTSQQEPVYNSMWNESMAGIKKHLITYSRPSNFTILAERPNGLDNAISPKMDHLVCFMPGTIALATTGGIPVAQARKQGSWTAEHEENMQLAEELMKTCWGMYTITSTGLAGEITYFNTHDPPLMYEDFTSDNRPKSPRNFDRLPSLPGVDSRPIGTDDYIIKSNDAHNLQRPETVESLFYMWRITGDTKYREWGWKMFEEFMKHTAVLDGSGYSSISSVNILPPPLKDNMESFWLAETLKYFYLLFSPNDMLPLTDVVFNTEAHPFPRFQLGKLFKTGWERKARDAEGKLVQETQKHEGAPAVLDGMGPQKIEAIHLTETRPVATSTLADVEAAATTAAEGADIASAESTMLAT